MRRPIVSHRVRRWRAPHMSWTHQLRDSRPVLLSTVLVLLTVTAWSYGPALHSLLHGLQRNDDYSAGLLVPLVAAFLVRRERETLRECPLAPCWVAGIALLLLAEVVRVYGLFSVVRPSAEHYAMALTVASLVLLVAGWQVFRRVLWILLFLFLMVPLPERIHNLISPPLQRVATTGSVFLLEAFGVSVNQQGNVVVLNGSTSLAVAEACSGLRVLTAFVIVAAFIAYMVKRKAIPAVVVALLALVATLRAEMMPVSPPDGGYRQLPWASGPADLPYVNASNPFVCPGIADLDLLPVESVPAAAGDVGRDDQVQPVQVLSDGQNSFDLCLYALIGLGLCRSAPFVKKLSIGPIPDWHHSGGPFQMGHSHAIGSDLRSIPVHCFVQPDGKVPDGPPRYDRGTRASLWRKSQFTPLLLAPRGPPLLS